MSQCKRCNRPLKSGESIIRQYGPTCWQRHLDDLEQEFLKNQLTIFDILRDTINGGDEDVTREMC